MTNKKKTNGMSYDEYNRKKERFAKILTSILLILCVVCFLLGLAVGLLSCTLDFSTPQKGNLCTDNTLINYCSQGSPFEGNWEVTQVRPYICNCSQDESFTDCCENFTWPELLWNHCAIIPSGYLSFTPNKESPNQGVLVSEMVWHSSCDTSFYEQLNFLSEGSYLLEKISNQIFLTFQSFNYGGDKLIGKIFTNRGALEIEFAYEDNTPAFDVRLEYLGNVNECPYYETLYDNLNYGFCYSEDNCTGLLASCITQKDCLWVLENMNQASGSWVTWPELECSTLAVPSRPLYPDPYANYRD